jgi:hypothetical protein
MVNGTKMVLVSRVASHINGAEIEADYNLRLSMLDTINYEQVNGGNRRMKTSMPLANSMIFRPFPPLNVEWLLPERPGSEPVRLPTTYPWVVIEELTPPLLLFRLKEHCPVVQHQADNCLAIDIPHRHVENRRYNSHTLSTVILVYKIRDISITYPQQLLSKHNLEPASNSPLRAVLSSRCKNDPGKYNFSTNYIAMNIKTATPLALCLSPNQQNLSAPITLWLWRIRAGDNLVVQVVQAITEPSCFRVAATHMAPLSLDHIPRLSPEAVRKSLFVKNVQNQEEDIIVGSIAVSLKCPVSLLPIQAPVRSRACRHVQCFDWSSFVAVLAPKPNSPFPPNQFKCPVCFKECLINDLVYDDYFREIITASATIEGRDEDSNCSVLIDSCSGDYSFTSTTLTPRGTGDGDELLLTSRDVCKKIKLEPVEPAGTSWLNPIVLD